MVTALLVGYLAAHLALLAWSCRLDGPPSLRLVILRLLLAGMIYDNLMLTLGNAGVGSAWYAAASSGRFVLHAILLPLLIPFALSALRACAVPIAERRGLVLACWAVAAAAWAYGLWFDVGGLALTPAEALGHLRLTSAAALPPLGTIAVNLLLALLAYLLWRSADWPLLLIASLLMLLLNGAVGGRDWGYLAGNGAEVAFMLCLLLTERFVIGQAGRGEKT